jgi:hypothetical protein
MGQYAFKNGQQGLKVGTMDDFRYVRYGEAERLVASGNDQNGDIRYGLETLSAVFRFPFPDEDNQGDSKIGERSMFRTLPPFKISADLISKFDHGERVISLSPEFTQLSYNNNVFLPCPVGEAIKKAGIKQSGTALLANIYGERYDKDGKPRTIFRCAWCGSPFSVGASDIDAIRETIAKDHGPHVSSRIHANPASED